jgi:hypothetical protein
VQRLQHLAGEVRLVADAGAGAAAGAGDRDVAAPEVTFELVPATKTPKFSIPEEAPPVPWTVTVPPAPVVCTLPPARICTPSCDPPESVPPVPCSSTLPVRLWTVPPRTLMPMKLPPVGVACWLAESVKLPEFVCTVAPGLTAMLLVVIAVRLLAPPKRVVPWKAMAPAAASLRSMLTLLA